MGHLKPQVFENHSNLACNSRALGMGQNLSGTRAGTIDRGAKTFFSKKGGDRLFFFEKNLGGEDFFYYKI